MYNILINLINKKFYADRDAAVGKVDVCFATDKITADQYSTLVLLIDEKYPVEEVVEE